MADGERRAEIEAVARVLIGAHRPSEVDPDLPDPDKFASWRAACREAERAIAALDRVRDTRGDEPRAIELAALSRVSPSRDARGDDDRDNRQDWGTRPEDWHGQPVPACDGTVAVEDVAQRLREFARNLPAGASETYRQAFFDAAALAEFSPASTGDRPLSE